MTQGLSGKCAVVMGAAGAGNMGQAIARRLAEDGAKVCVAGRNEAALSELAAILDGTYALCDITDPSAVSGMVRDMGIDYGRIDIAVNAVGWGLTKKFLNTTGEDLDKMLAVQFKGPYFFMQSVIPAMQEQGGGSIIQISSATATLATQHHSAYAGTKAGIDHVIRTLAGEFGPYGIRINSISPGFTKTPMTREAARVPGMEEAFVAEYPLGRIGTRDDIAAACAFLASDACFMTGQNLQVNGGLTLRRNPTASEIAASIERAQDD